MTRPTPIQPPSVPRLQMPAAPAPVHSEIRDAALETIEAEQWLQSNGWRDAVLELGSPKSDTFLAGYARLRGRIAELEVEIGLEGRAELRTWQRLATAAVAFSVLWTAGFFIVTRLL